MTYAGFRSYVADVLARLVKLCSQKLLPVSRGEQILKWAKTQAPMIWDSFEAHEAIDDVAAALFNMSAEATRKGGVQCADLR